MHNSNGAKVLGKYPWKFIAQYLMESVMNLQLGQLENLENILPQGQEKGHRGVEIFSFTTTQPAKSVATSRRFPINNIIIITSSSRLSL